MPTRTRTTSPTVLTARASQIPFLRLQTTVCVVWRRKNGGGTRPSASVVGVRRPTRALDLAAAALLVDALRRGRRTRSREPTRRRHVQTLRELRPQPLERQRAVAALRSRIGRDRGDDGAEPLEQPITLARTERRGLLDPEHHFDTRLG